MDWIFPDYLLGRRQERVRIAQKHKRSRLPQRQTASCKNVPPVYFTTLPPLLLWIQLHLEELLFLTYPSSLWGCKQRLWLMHETTACLQEALSAGTFWDAPPLGHLSMSKAPFALPSMQLFTSDVWGSPYRYFQSLWIVSAFVFLRNVNCGRDLR